MFVQFPRLNPSLPPFFPSFKVILFQRRAMDYQQAGVILQSTVGALVTTLQNGLGGASGLLLVLQQTMPSAVLEAVENEMTAVSDAVQDLLSALQHLGMLLNNSPPNPVAIQAALEAAVTQAIVVFSAQEQLIAGLPTGTVADNLAEAVTANRNAVFDAHEALQEAAAAVFLAGQRALQAQAYCGAMCGFTGDGIAVASSASTDVKDKTQLRHSATQEVSDATRLTEMQTAIFRPYPVSGF
jgi:hypothetical protein